MATEGNKVGKYIITSKIAEGGMGAIYKAKHPTLNRSVILKRLTLKRNSSITERFKREAQLMLDFRHDHIVQVYDHFKEGSSYYIAMEYVDGVSLGDLIENKRYIPNEIAMLIITEICEALKYAHDKGVIHRDIKPENILISKEGEVKLTDFGIATSKDSEDEGLTSAGMTLGTPAYMSPEQISDTKNVDKKADIYSMGVVLYKMVTGKTPFPGSFTPDAISLINKGEYIYPRKINPRVSPLIQKVIKKAMNCKYKKRYKDLQYIISIFSGQLRKYKDQETINNTIKLFLGGKDITSAERTPTSDNLSKMVEGITVSFSSNQSRIILASIIVFCLISLGAYIAYLDGQHYEYFKQNEYGSLSISVKSLKKYKDADECYINAYLFQRDGKKFKKVLEPNINFRIDEDSKSKKYNTLTSEKIYLKTAGYRLQINFENEQFQKDFYLNPRVLQKENKDTLDSKNIKFYHNTVRHLPLKVRYTIKDINNNNDITNSIDFSIYVYKRWKKWSDFRELKNYKEILVSGKIHKFKFEKDDYYTQIRRIYIKPEQTVLAMEIDLIPVPGSLSLQSNYSGLEVLVNNSTSYLSGGKYRKYKQINSTTKKIQKLLFAPGDYFLTIKKSRSMVKTIRITVKPKKATRVLINYNKVKHTLKLNIKS